MPTTATDAEPEPEPTERIDPRPDNCQCWGQDGLACWYCYRAGFETGNPTIERDTDG